MALILDMLTNCLASTQAGLKGLSTAVVTARTLVVVTAVVVTTEAGGLFSPLTGVSVSALLVTYSLPVGGWPEFSETSETPAG